MLHHISTLNEPGLEVFSTLTEAQLRHRLEPTAGIFIAESPKVIRIALARGFEPLSLLCEQRHIDGDAADIVRTLEQKDKPVYTGPRELLAQLTGYTLTRGVLCAMRRPQLPSVADICHGARRIVVIKGVVDTTNIGAIFRSAAALGIDGVLLTPDSCDPLNRRAVRVSMGSVFLVPWTWLPVPNDQTTNPPNDQTTNPPNDQTTNPLTPITSLRQYGFKTVSMALTDHSVPIDDATLAGEPRLAIILGTEGDGLPHDIIAKTDYVARIPMAHGVDSLNVAAAAAVAFWQLRASKLTS